jgi:hypothetical protein
MMYLDKLRTDLGLDTGTVASIKPDSANITHINSWSNLRSLSHTYSSHFLTLSSRSRSVRAQCMPGTPTNIMNIV